MNANQYSPYGAGKIAGATEERERIIKLLEEELTCLCDLGKSNAIDLIKGEKDEVK